MRDFFQSVSDNAGFLLICLAIAAAIILLAKLFEHLTKAELHRPGTARYAAFVGMAAAIGGVLMCFDLPLFFAPSFYQLDFSELPILMTSFYLGPTAGVLAELLKVLVKLLLKGTSTAFVGDLANFFVGCSFILPASVIYHIKKTRKSALWGMAAGTLVMTVFGSLFNAFYLLPAFSRLYGMPLDAIIGMAAEVNSSINSIPTLVLMAVVPFNLLKGVLISAITFPLYKRLERLLGRLFAQHGRKTAKEK